MKYVSIISGATELPEQSVAHLTHDLIFRSGIVDLNSDHFLVEENNPTAREVVVNEGRAYFKKTSMTYSGYTDDAEVVSIAANNSGNPRISALVAMLDLSATPDADGQGVLSFVEVLGTPASSPTTPSDEDIQLEIGAGNPFVRLANITVANAATQILNANISDQRTRTVLSPIVLDPGIITAVDGSTVTFDLGSGAHKKHKVTLGGNRTLALSNVMVGQTFMIDIIQDATGSRTVTWFSGIKWPFGVVPTLTTTANKIDSFGFICTGSGAYQGYQLGSTL